MIQKTQYQELYLILYEQSISFGAIIKDLERRKIHGYSILREHLFYETFITSFASSQIIYYEELFAQTQKPATRDNKAINMLRPLNLSNVMKTEICKHIVRDKECSTAPRDRQLEPWE